MTAYEFNALPEAYQLTAVAATGRFLHMAWEEELAVSLYHFPGGLLIELAYDVHAYRISRIRAITSPNQLVGYLASCPLSIF